MGNKSFVCACILAVLGVVMLSAPFPAFSQGRDRDIADEQLFEIGKTGIAELQESPAAAAKKTFVDKEEKYTAGKDKEWFTGDDANHEYYMIEHDAAGKMLKKTHYKAGKDRIPYTYDDKLQDFQLFEHGFDGKILKESSFDGQNVKQYALQYTVTYQYDAEGRKVKTTRYDPRHKEIRSTVLSYDPSGFLVRDTDYVGKDVEKYHHCERDGAGRIIRVMEYHKDHDGKGPDGAWFTPDDVVSSAKEFIYNADGTKSQENKYISPGADGKWFTDDDEMQYYVIFELHGLETVDVESNQNIH